MDDGAREIGQLLLDAPLEFGLWFVVVLLAFLLHRHVRLRVPKLAVFTALAPLTLMVILGQFAILALVTALQGRFDVSIPYGGKSVYHAPVARFIGLWICLYISTRLALRFQERGTIKSTPPAVLAGTGIVFIGATLLTVGVLLMKHYFWLYA